MKMKAFAIISNSKCVYVFYNKGIFFLKALMIHLNKVFITDDHKNDDIIK